VNVERTLERLRDYRLKNKRFARLVRLMLANQRVARPVRALVAAARSVSRRGQTLRPGDYDTVFFIVGEMRSGTSWLQHSLSVHPEIACGQEGSFFGRGYDREEITVYRDPVSSLTRALAVSKEFRVWHGLPWNLWAEGYEEDLRALSRLSVDYFLSKEVARTGRRIVGDKSPQHTECLDEIHEIYPDAKIIHIVRDGRDVAVSAMHHWWRLAKDQEKGIFEMTPEELRLRDDYMQDRERFLASGYSIFTEERLAQLARRWNYRTGKGRRDGNTLYGEKYLEIRYEDFLQDTSAVFGRVLEFLEADREDRTIKRCLQMSDFGWTSSRRQGEEDPRSFFRKGIAGDWRSVFTERDRAIYKELAGERLVEFGYEKSLTW
jgi:Sulfotransferase family